MALSKRTVNQHNIKRAEVFAANGLNDLDVAYAHPRFNGFGTGTCVLCGQQHLKWLFSIKFDAPSGIVALAKVGIGIDREGEVTLSPVGSKCITDWLDAIPETPEKLAALKRWEHEMRRCKEAMTAKVVEDLCNEFGFPTAEAAYAAYASVVGDYRRVRAALTRYEANRLSRNAPKVRNMRGSRATVRAWLEDLKKVLDTRPTPPPAPTPPVSPAAPSSAPATPALPQADQDLLARGDAAWIYRDRLTPYNQTAFTDIAQKVRRYGKFVSLAQRNYYTDMLAKLEGK